ncbi:hypothetical protein M8J75_014441 [Diaphorina citri]|nr:hypothetical protein M8J75_014441 [Diaphorina citri]
MRSRNLLISEIFPRLIIPIVWLAMLLFNDVTRVINNDNILFTTEISKNKERELTVKTIMMCEYWISNCLMMFNIVYGLKQMRALPNILATLSSIETNVGKYFDPNRLRQIHRKENILSKCLVLLCILTTVIPITVSYMQMVETFRQKSLEFMQIVIKDASKAIIFSVELQFSILCIYIYHRMELVNSLFAQCFLRNELTTHTTDVPPSLAVKHKRFRGYTFDQGCLGDRFRILMLTKQNHETMFRLGEDLRRAYELQLMCSVGEIFFNIINHVYVTVKMFRPGEPPYLNSIINLMWAIQETVRVIMFCVAASVAADEINRTLWYASSIDVHNLDLRIRHQVKCFNLHLQHRKLKFSLCQMFTINTTFLAAMAVGIVNSLMLSLQYKYSDKQSLSSNG